MSHIFISYYQGDADFAAVLSIRIEGAGIETWMDKNRLRPGQDWSVEIDEAIINSQALIVIMSPEAKASEYVTYEWSFALGAGVQVIPVLYKETPLHPRLARLHYLKFTDTTVRPWDTLVENLKEAVNSSGVYAVRLPRSAPPYIKSAVVALDSANDADRGGAIRVLAQTDHPTARQALVSALQHPLRDVRWDAARNLVGDPRAVPVLVDAFLNARDDNLYESKRLLYAQHLAASGPGGMKSLLEFLVDPNVDPDMVAGALSNFEGGEAIQPLLQLLYDSDPEHRQRAVLALGRQSSDSVTRELVSALEDSNIGVRLAAIEAFRWRSQGADTSESGWEGLLLCLRNTSKQVRYEAVRHFNYHTPESVQMKLVAMTRTEPLPIALAAHRALFRTAVTTQLMKLGVITLMGEERDIQPDGVLMTYENTDGGDRIGEWFYCAPHKISETGIKAHRIVEEDGKVLIDSQQAVTNIISNYFMTNLSLGADTLRR